MQKKNQRNFFIAISILVTFVLWTISLCFVDVQPVGPQGSSVGFVMLNCFVHNRIGVHMALYQLTDWLGLVPLGFGLGFAVLGAVQWRKRRKLRYVDFSILALGGFYIVLMAVYLFFENFVINYRPILIDGFLEASYPSSTTMLVMCVMSTAIMQLRTRIKGRILRHCVTAVLAAFAAFMVVGRLISGVHWITDIIGGMFLSCGLVMLYHSVCCLDVK